MSKKYLNSMKKMKLDLIDALDELEICIYITRKILWFLEHYQYYEKSIWKISKSCGNMELNTNDILDEIDELDVLD